MGNKVFITGTGRCGTKAIAEAFGGVHEYNVWEGPRIVQYFQEKNPKKYIFADNEFREYVVDQMFSDIPTDDFLDSDNSLTHLLDLVYNKFTDAKFILCVRDGRDYVTSAANRNWHAYSCLDHKPLPNEEYYNEWDNMSIIQKNAWSWVYKNQRCLDMFKLIPEEQTYIFKVEDSKDDNKLKQLESFVGFELDIDTLRHKKVNSNNQTNVMPYKADWTEEMKHEFDDIASNLMKKFNYYE
tara:strand:- start:1071 stop:1790 length:720 start_codon:yes stop_codon:yes gene_type:complete